MCEQQYFIEYILGWRGLSNKKADKGTIVHKVLEILAYIKKNQQDGNKSFIDDIAGEIFVDKYNLSNIYDIVYKHYTTHNSHHQWIEKDHSECWSWINKTLTQNNGMFDPRNRKIVQPEQHFDIVIDKPWAKFKYETDEGLIEGNLAIKGTIDLITEIDEGFYEIVDWKTGKRLNWATGKEKTQECLENDPQLRIYHYAVSKLYPLIDNIMVSINFINDGGPFTVCFGSKDLEATELMLKQKFDIIRNTKRPKLHKTWMCNKLCFFGKTTFENTDIPHIVEYRDGQTTPKDAIMSKCQQIKHDTDLLGIDDVIKTYKKSGHSIGYYQAPGEVNK
jgi:hypothetical protein